MDDNTTNKPAYTVSVKPAYSSNCFQLFGERLVENIMARDIVTTFLMNDKPVPNGLFKTLH